jgi:hypothetical protein
MTSSDTTERRAGERSVAPTTTTQEDLTTAGQRKVNLIWEYTQAIIASFVTLATVAVAVYIAVTTREFPQVLISAFFLIVGFYFSRTNHAAIGGTGAKPQQPYQGR